jgi:splicing factor 3B subunit 4
MLQAGRIVNVHLPKDRVSQSHQGYGFVEFISEEDADYAAKIMNQIRLFGKPIRVNKASADKQKTVEVGAELFVGNLDSMVTEQTLYETFSRFGGLLTVPKVRFPTQVQLEANVYRLQEMMQIFPKATDLYPSLTLKPQMMRLQI